MVGLPQLDANNRIARGFAHDFTGHMLTPVEYDWSDENCANSFFVNCLYAGNKGDPNDVEKGYLRNGYLAYKYIFTSPSSAISGDATGIESGIPITSGDPNAKSTKQSNAAKAKMEGVTGRSIAYVAVLVIPPQPSTTASTILHSIRRLLTISRYPHPKTQRGQAKAVLQWWNQRVFPGVAISDDNQSEPTANFLATVQAQRRRRATAVTEGIST
ncbi:hypothetical protein ONZ45_g9455 [Pleurotus djamor]|nr:hypothetical protein ONZ45_g9455 [Pleurotus djamor]